MALTKLEIMGFRIIREKKKTPVKKFVDSFVVQINPASLKWVKGINFSKMKPIGRHERKKFDLQTANTLSFDIVLDDTGVVESEAGNIKDRIALLEKVVYDINSEAHEPNYAKIVWGSITFYGRLSSLSYNYTLFKPDGAPLRVKISLSFVGYKEDIEVKSPDLSRVVTVKAGDTIPALCQEYYDDPSYCMDIAKVNNLVNFRNVKPGTQLLFPPLGRYGRIIEQ